MGVFHDSVIHEERREAETFIKYLPPPNCAVRTHQVYLTNSIMRWLQVAVDGIPGLKVVLAGLVRGEQSESAIPAPPRRFIRIDVLVSDIASNGSYIFDISLSEHLHYFGEEVLLENDVIIDKSDKITSGGFDSDIALNGGPAPAPDVHDVEWDLSGERLHNCFGFVPSRRSGID
jgi:hypothetical protein